jgi:hypothetical protein
VGGLLGILLLAAGARPVIAQPLEQIGFADLEFRAIGAEFGTVWPARVEPASTYGIRADLGSPTPRVRILGIGRYWSSRLKEWEVRRLAEQILLVCERQVDATCPETLELGNVNLSDLELGADGRYHFLVERRISPFLGVGVGLHLLNGRGDFIDGTFVEDLLDTVAPGLGPILGVDLRLGSALAVGVEARFMLASDVRYASVGAGGLWRLPTPAGAAQSTFSSDRQR